MISEEERKQRARDRQRKWRAEHPEKNLAAVHRWRAANPDKYRAATRKWRGLPEPTRPCPDRCEICGRITKYSLHIDHDHVAGKFCGWLCKTCNQGLGQLLEDIDLLKRAIEYLQAAGKSSKRVT